MTFKISTYYEKIKKEHFLLTSVFCGDNMLSNESGYIL